MPAVINIGKMAKGIRYVDSDKTFDTDNVLSEFVSARESDVQRRG